ncbi:polyprotein, partial [mine drainage metagenome]
SYLSRHLHQPTTRLLYYCKLVLRYVRTTKDKRLYLGNLDGTSLVAYADANFAPSGDRKSQSGGLVKLAGSSISWSSKKQKTVSQSTAEAEYIALADVCNEVLWLQKLMEELAVSVEFPTVIYEDNQPTISVVKNQKGSKVSRHIDTRYQAIEDYMLKGYVDV